MSRRTSGMIFITISALLYAIRYISELFNNMLTYVGEEPRKLSKAALWVGIAFLVWAEVEEYIRKYRVSRIKSLLNPDSKEEDR
ncbi:hypothetical protein [Paenibacillus sp. MMS20-IR301]|uniref:hypothetical protein n=1 Tax=Paenibacillus sp. MMS20-IR301 TaxID=2895946 RepID=UPI0028E709E7|nr:hypothetical protein [Paenibacillus sp. MMS20-IR301]WNS45830.1 hypothetical protein LOS79_11340 [Paenibacillus sp. MMS20-IR301]